MVQLILLILGIVYAFRRPKLKRLSAAEFPDIPADRFLEWKRLELMSINVFLWSTWGLLLLGCLLSIVIGLALGFSGAEVARQGGLVFQGAYLGLFLVGLLVSAIYGSKAQKLRKSSGIQWPRKKHSG